jgi:phage terminase small subunit
MRRLPENVKQLRGTAQPCRSIGETLDFEPVEEIPPAPISLGVHGKAYWDRIVPLLLAKRVLTVVDLESLEIMCMMYHKVLKASFAETDLNAASVTQLRLYQTEFGLTPASRAKLKAGDDGPKGNKFSGNGKKKT